MRLIIAAVILLAAGVVVFVVCLFTLDSPMSYDYEVTLADSSTQTLRVSMTVSSPFFRKVDSAFIYLGDKNVKVLGCFDENDKLKETFLSDDGIIEAPVSRGGKTSIIYDVPVGMPAKHGDRGAVSEDYIIFDGDQAFLLPALFYVYDDTGIRRSIDRISFTFYFPPDWEEIVPFTRIDNPGWNDVYALSKNAFVFGKFSNILSTDEGLNVYALADSAKPETSGFGEMFDYYTDLFGSSPAEFSVVLLPSDDREDKIIGGSGTAVTAASFDYGLLRDWQLLSHRLFHAFYDTAAPYVNVHVPPNLWFNEGLATYYENMAMEALPEPLKSKLGVDVERQFALIFDQYLYMRIKDPFAYTFAAMDEDKMESGALTEFLHYTAAPLIVKSLIDESVKLGNAPDDLLKYCLTEDSSPITPLWAALELLKDDSQKFCESYMLGTGIPPLWYLKDDQPPSQEVLEALNYIEIILESWWKLENSSYQAHVVTGEQLDTAMKDVEETQVLFLPQEAAGLIRNYCPEVYALLNDYYRQAEEKGIEFDDKDLRSKLLETKRGK
jgi:hypothetical protein